MRLRRRLIQVMLVCALCAGVLALRAPVRRWLKVDSCLDAGGSWDYAMDTCEHSAPELLPHDDVDQKMRRDLTAGDY